MAVTLTRKLIETALAAGPGNRPYVMLWDNSPKGLGLRIRRGGASWVYRYRPKNAPRNAPVKTATFGAWPTLGLVAARALALDHASRVAFGHDPNAERHTARLRERSTLTMALNDYDTHMRRRGIVQRKAVMSSLWRGFAPVIRSELADLDLRTVVGLVNRIATTPKRRKDGTSYTTPGAAAGFRTRAHNFLSWAAQTGLVAANVLAGLRLGKPSREERLQAKNRAGRALDDREIVLVWRTSTSMGNFGALLRMLLLTGARRGELAELRWTDITVDRLVIPEARTKMGRTHEVALTPVMREILAAQPRSTRSRLVFPSEVTGSVITGWSERMAQLIKASGVRFTMHDLRRSVRTNFSRLGVDDAVAESCIGHVRRGLEGIYNKDFMWERRVAAFERLSAHISGLLAAERSPIDHRLDQDVRLPAEPSLVERDGALAGSP